MVEVIQGNAGVSRWDRERRDNKSHVNLRVVGMRDWRSAQLGTQDSIEK